MNGGSETTNDASATGIGNRTVFIKQTQQQDNVLSSFNLL